jgi:hypothetical protein
MHESYYARQRGIEVVGDMYSECGAQERRMDFNFNHQVAVNRFREIEIQMNIIIDNLTRLYDGEKESEEEIAGVKVPRPTDQRLNLSVFFSDYFPNTEDWKVTVKGHYAGGLPFGPPHSGREKHVFRMPSCRRVDLGMSYRLVNNEERRAYYGLLRHVKNVWIGVDAFNILDISNVNSYYWVTDVNNARFAVPNYLTGRQLNFRFLVEL